MKGFFQKRSFVFLLTGLLCVAGTACVLRWQLFPTPPLHYRFNVAWEEQVEHPVTLAPVAIGDQVLFVSGDTLYTYCQDNGQPQERRLVGADLKTVLPYSQRTFLAAGNTLTLWSLGDEKPLWSYELHGPLLAAALNRRQGFFVSPSSLTKFTSSPFHIVSRDLETLLRGNFPRRGHASPKGALKTPIQPLSALLAGGRLYLGTEKNQLYAFDAESERVLWSFHAGGAFRSAPAVWRKTLFVGSDDKRFYALSAKSGRKKWSLETGGAIRSAPVVFGNSVFFVSYDLILYALHVENGHRLWNVPIPNRVTESPLVTPYGVAVKPVFGNSFYLYGVGDGSPRGSFTLNDPDDHFTSRLLYAEGRFFVGTYKGRILALDIEEIKDSTVKKDTAPVNDSLPPTR